MNDYSDCKSPEEVHKKLKANTSTYFDEDGCNQLLQYGQQYIQDHKKPKNIPHLLDEMEKHGTLRTGCYDNFKKLVKGIDRRMLKSIEAAENAILEQTEKERKARSDDQIFQGMTGIRKPLDVIQEDVQSLNNKLGEDNSSKKIDELIKELGDMVEIMPEEVEKQYESIIEETSDMKRHFKAIIIAGETCAGKTTLMNKLLDYNLFEDSNSPSTSAMVFLHYRDECTIKVYARENKGKKLKFKAFDITLTTLKRHLEEYTRKSTYCVHVFYPAQVLKHGIVIVDTPSFNGLVSITDYFKEMPQQILTCVFILNASCSNWCLSENGEAIPRFLFELLQCIKKSDLLVKGEILFLINKWETVMTTGEDKEKFEEDAWFQTKHRILFALKEHITNMDIKSIYKVSLGKMGVEKDEPYKLLRREYSRFEDYLCRILQKRNTEILINLTAIANQCRSIMKKKLKRMKKEKKKHKKCESDLKGNLAKLESICPSAEIEDSDSDLDEHEEKFRKARKRRKRDLDGQE